MDGYSQNKILTPLSLWEGFDSTLPLKESVIKVIKFGNIEYNEIYFSGRQTENDRVRIFGLYAKPVDGLKHSAILLIPDITRKINYDEVNDYVSLGYNVLVVDLIGKRDEAENFTNYPKDIEYANLAQSGRHLNFVDDTAKETCWYEWTAVEKYAISFLKSKPEIEKIGIVGIENGANIAWQLAANDDRISCSVMMFGAGWSAYKGISKFSDDSEIVLDVEKRRFLAGIDSVAYSQYVKCPLLYLTSTNNDFFDCDRAYDTLSRIDEKIPYIFNFAPKYNRYLDENCKSDLKLFFLKYLSGEDIVFEKSPELTVNQDGNELTLTVNAYNYEKLTDIKIYISEGVADSAYRNWVTGVKTSGENGNFKFDYFINGNSTLVNAFAIAKYVNGTVISSKIVSKKLTELPDKKSNLVYSSKFGFDGMTFNDAKLKDSPTMFINESDMIEMIEGAGGIKGVYSKYGLLSYKFNEHCVILDENSIIKFDIFNVEFCNLNLCLMTKTDDVVTEYIYNLDVKAGSIWQNFNINVLDFKSKEGLGIRKFDKIYCFKIESDSKFAVNNIIVI